MGVSLNDLKNSAVASLNQHLFCDVVKEKKKSKYGNKIVWFDGIRFMSIREKDRYIHLKLLQKAGEIKDLRLQVKYTLTTEKSRIESYIADFVYVDVLSGKEICEDCKGARTATYRRKAKWMKEFYGIEILET